MVLQATDKFLVAIRDGRLFRWLHDRLCYGRMLRWI